MYQPILFAKLIGKIKHLILRYRYDGPIYMKTLEFETRGLLQLLEDEGVNIICDGNMDLKISDEDLVLMKELVSDFATVVEYDDYVVLYN